MKIQDKTVMYKHLVRDEGFLMNILLLLCFMNARKGHVNFWIIVGSLVVIMVIAPWFLRLRYRGDNKEYNAFYYKYDAVFFLLFSVAQIVAGFILGALYGMIILACFFIEIALIHVVEYRWKIANKIKAACKKKSVGKRFVDKS